MLSSRSGAGTILIVEDQPGLRALTEEILSSAGYSILVAPDGAEALRVAQEYCGQIQLLLTDVTLPKIGGIETAARLHTLRPDMKVLFMSGLARGAMTGSGTLDPQANFIQKPWSPQGLCDEIGKILTAEPSAQRILVVDDEEGMRDWLSEVLEGCGHRVFTARDGVEALSLARRQALNLVITDISMPNEDGLGIVCALRKAHPEIKIIAMSGAFAAVLKDAKLLGANAALVKPFTSEMLLKCMRDVAPMQTSGKVA